MAAIETDSPRTGSLPRVTSQNDVSPRDLPEETKLSLKTTEFWAMGGVIGAILVASAISDSLGDVRAWTLVAVVASAYIISRGLAKAGTHHNGNDRVGRS